MKQTRVPSVPLITCDTYFSIWSPFDNLTDGDTTHWCGRRKQMVGTVSIDGVKYRFMGDSKFANKIDQVGLTITATESKYTFQNASIILNVSFTTPLLLTDLELVSRPCSYIDFTVESADGDSHDVVIYLSLNEEFTYDKPLNHTISGGAHVNRGNNYAYLGKIEQAPLSQSGDNISIDWGHLYLSAPSAQNATISFNQGAVCTLEAEVPFGAVTKPVKKYVVVGYDDLAAINYFGTVKKGYWTKFTPTILDALDKSISQHDEIIARCDTFDADIKAKATASINENYAEIAALAYRQTIAAHKLIEDDEGNLIFLSKENDSNGCIGTVDLSYPSSPLYLLYNTEYVKGMMRPIFKFAACDVWEYDFAPHDVGRYPYAIGQVYGTNQTKHGSEIRGSETCIYPHFYMFPKGCDCYNEHDQMPLEESANMLVMAAAVCKIDGNADFVKPYYDTLKTWTDYLIKFGANPGEQLCTDDFAGHSAGNVNLSAKAIMGVYSFALLSKQLGHYEQFTQYNELARKMAADWESAALVIDHTTLSFGQKDTWSLKYNTIWDRFFGGKLFTDKLFEIETKWYLKENNKYGVPLDSRKTYTKSDWIMWCASMTDNKKSRAAISDPMQRYLSESNTRVAFSDWYDTVSGDYCHFINRSVQGGLFMPILIDNAQLDLQKR